MPSSPASPERASRSRWRVMMVLKKTIPCDVLGEGLREAQILFWADLRIVINVTKPCAGSPYHCRIQERTMPTVKLTAEKFKSEIFDYTTEKEWKFKGNVPVIIDFYADWCGPCKTVAPVLEELSEEYKDQLTIYKVDTEKEMELSSIFGIRSIPSILFIPMEGQPMMQAGAFPKSAFKSIIDKELIPSGATTEK